MTFHELMFDFFILINAEFSHLEVECLVIGMVGASLYCMIHVLRSMMFMFHSTRDCVAKT